MVLANFKPKRTAAASRDFLAIVRLSCFATEIRKRVQTRKELQQSLVNFKMFTGAISVQDRQFRLQQQYE